MAEVYRFDRALARRPADSAVDGLRSVDRGTPDIARFRAEHAAYVAALEAAGVAVDVLPELADYPDSVFVEDPALTFPEGAILLRPGAPSRFGEAAELATALRERFETVLTLDGGHADGGDILVTPRAVLVGRSARTDAAGAKALVAALATLGRVGEVVTPPPGVLHFKTACSLLDEETVLAAGARADYFPGMRVVRLPDGEEAAANALRVNDVVMLGAGFPRTRELLDGLGYSTVPLPVEETRKLDAGLSCMSLRWLTPAAQDSMSL